MLVSSVCFPPLAREVVSSLNRCTAGTLVDSSNGGEALNGDLVNVSEPLIKGPLLGSKWRRPHYLLTVTHVSVDLQQRDRKRQRTTTNAVGSDLMMWTRNASSRVSVIGGPGAGLLAGTLLDSSNGGEMLNGDLVNVDKSLIKGPIISECCMPNLARPAC